MEDKEVTIAEIQRQENARAGADPLGLTEAQIERLYQMGADGALLWLMRATWINHGGLGEPFRENAAVEIALNELVAYARDKDWDLQHRGRFLDLDGGIVVKVMEEGDSDE